MSGKLTTHVIDTARGCPAGGIHVRVSMVAPQPRHLHSTITNTDGRCDKPLLEDDMFKPGTYELVFSVGAYFAQHVSGLPSLPYLDDIVLRFGIASSEQHCHVPLLVSPYGYSTYRGS